MLRPQPAAGRTADKAAAMGFDVRLHPLFAPRAVAWTPPPAGELDALLLTSAHGVRMAGDELRIYRALPAYAVGAATARALCEAGFADVTAGDSDGSAIAARIAADGHRRVLHLAGTTVAPLEAGPLGIIRVAVYTMTALPPDPALAADATAGAVVLVHSPRAGRLLADRIGPAARGTLHLVAISDATLKACGGGWASAHAPDRPDDDDMLALARALCE
nr:uroporphyrinogen-III synthase [Sphingobium sp. OAS761]